MFRHLTRLAVLAVLALVCGTFGAIGTPASASSATTRADDAKPGTAAIMVLEKGSLSPVIGIGVELRTAAAPAGDVAGTLTNKMGIAFFAGLAPGRYEASVTRDKQTATARFQIFAGQHRTVLLLLEP